MKRKKEREISGPPTSGGDESLRESERLGLEGVEGRDRGAMTGREQGAEVNTGAGASEARSEDEPAMTGVTQDRDRIHRAGEGSGEPTSWAHQAGWQPSSGEEIRQAGHSKAHPDQDVHGPSNQQRQADDSFLGGKSRREGAPSVSHAAQQRAGLTPGGGNQRTAEGPIGSRGQGRTERTSQQQPASEAGKGERQQGLGDRSYGGTSQKGDRDKGGR